MSSSSSQHDPSSADSSEAFNPIAIFYAILRRKILFIGVFAAVFLTGVVVAMNRTPQNSFVTVLQIGSAYGSNSVSGKLVEDAGGVVTKLERTIVPEIARAWRSEHPEGAVPELLIKAKSTAGIVLLMTKAGMDQQSAVSAFHRSVVEKIVQQHESLVMAQYQSHLSEAQQQLDDAVAESNQLKESVAQHEQRKKLLKHQLERLNAEIDELSGARQAIVEKTDGENSAPALYIAQLDMPALLEHRDALEDELNIKQNLVLSELKRKIVVAQSNEKAALAEIALLKKEVNSLRLTRIQSLASPMPDHVGLSAKWIIIMSLLMGLLAAWFAVMFAEYMRRQLGAWKRQH